MQRQAALVLKTALFLGGVALIGCEKIPQASIAPKAEVPAAPAYTPAQQAWLNFVDKVRRGEQLDPTGQYVKDGTIVPADQEQRIRPKLDAARDRYPFRLRLDGTVVFLADMGASLRSAKGADTNVIDDPTEVPDPNYPPPSGPSITSTFVSSVGLGGSGDIVDIKTLYGSDALSSYTILNANLNKGAGGSDIFYHFTRLPSGVVQGVEYSLSNQFPNLSTADPVVAYETKTRHWFYQNTPEATSGFAPIWYPDFNISSSRWKPIDLNQGAGGEYVYTYQSKTLSVGNGAAPFHEVGILSGNSSQIQPPAGWDKDPQDLNDSAGGDFIYFCFKR